jgi:hypothetical protein
MKQSNALLASNIQKKKNPPPKLSNPRYAPPKCFVIVRVYRSDPHIPSPVPAFLLFLSRLFPSASSWEPFAQAVLALITKLPNVSAIDHGVENRMFRLAIFSRARSP